MKLESESVNYRTGKENFFLQQRGHAYFPAVGAAVGQSNRRRRAGSDGDRRYQAGFVGSASLANRSNRILFSELSLVEQTARRIRGAFSFCHPDRPNPFTLTATGALASSGNWHVALSDGNTSGQLKLVENIFDSESFALLGRVMIAQSDGGSGTLPPGTHAGNVAMLRPVETPRIFSPRAKTAFLTSISGHVVSAELSLPGTPLNRTVTGRLGPEGDPDAYEVTISSSARRTYLVGVNGHGFLTVRGGADLDENDCVVAFRGDYLRRDSAGRLVDFGVFDLRR